MIEANRLLATRSKITSHEVYATGQFYTRFLSSFSEEIERLVICSPAFDVLPKPFDNIIGFWRFTQQRGVEKVIIITRPPGSHLAAISQETAKYLDGQGVDIVIRPDPTLNANVYHLDFKRGWFRNFVGSAAFTVAGLETNQEVVAEVEGVGSFSSCQREITRLASDNNAISFPQWLQRSQPVTSGIAK